jgi:hypothetical protein
MENYAAKGHALVSLLRKEKETFERNKRAHFISFFGVDNMPVFPIFEKYGEFIYTVLYTTAITGRIKAEMAFQVPSIETDLPDQPMVKVVLKNEDEQIGTVVFTKRYMDFWPPEQKDEPPLDFETPTTLGKTILAWLSTNKVV